MEVTGESLRNAYLFPYKGTMVALADSTACYQYDIALPMDQWSAWLVVQTWTQHASLNKTGQSERRMQTTTNHSRRTQWTPYRLPIWSVWLSIWPFGCTGTSRDLNENLTEKSERPPHCIYRISFPRAPLAGPLRRAHGAFLRLCAPTEGRTFRAAGDSSQGPQSVRTMLEEC